MCEYMLHINIIDKDVIFTDHFTSFVIAKVVLKVKLSTDC